MIAIPAQKVFSLKPLHQFIVVQQLDRFDLEVVEKPFCMFLSELPNLIRNHLHLKVPMKVGVSNIPRCTNHRWCTLVYQITALKMCPFFKSHINSVYGALHCVLLLMITTPVQVPCFELAEWCQCCSVPCVPTAVCRRSTQASIFVCTASAYCVLTGPIFVPWANPFSCFLVQDLRVSSWHVSNIPRAAKPFYYEMWRHYRLLARLRSSEAWRRVFRCIGTDVWE